MISAGREFMPFLEMVALVWSEMWKVEKSKIRWR